MAEDTDEHRPTVSRRYGADSHVVYHSKAYEPEPALRIRDLVRCPVIRQWVEGGKIYREPAPREVPRFELFFDLLFVAIIHNQAEAAIEEPGGAAVARFVLTFWPSWSIWEEARKYSNVSGTDDLLHRTWVLLGMICILGYSVNASAIELHPTAEDGGYDHSAIQAAVAFWLIIKLTRVLVLFYYGWQLPLFRTGQILGGVAVLIPMLVFFPLLFVTSRTAQIIIATMGIVVDICRLDLIFWAIRGHVVQIRQRRAYRKQDEAVRGELPERTKWHKMPSPSAGTRLPAMNIEHAIERSSAFVVIVLGELVMNLLFVAGKGELGASPAFGRAALGLMVAWALNYLYLFPSEPNFMYEHALRRSFISGVTFTFLHWPLCASLTLASAASGEMVKDNVVATGLSWYWGCGLGFAVLFMTMIDMTHRDLQPRNSQRIPRFVRSFISFLAAMALIFFPFGGDTLTSFALLATGMGITMFLVVLNIYGMLPRKSYLRQQMAAGELEGSKGHENGNGVPDIKQPEAGNNQREDSDAVNGA